MHPWLSKNAPSDYSDQTLAVRGGGGAKMSEATFSDTEAHFGFQSLSMMVLLYTAEG